MSYQIFVHEINKIDEKTEENDIRVNIYIKKNHPIYFIFDSEEERKIFKKDLSYLKHLYKKYLNYFYPVAYLEIKKPIYFTWMIRRELEYRDWDNIELDPIDIKYLLKDKNMVKLFEKNSTESLRNRFLCNFMSIKVTKRTPNAIKTIEKEGQIGFFEKTFEKLDFGLKSLLILVGDIPITDLDEKLLTIDNLVLVNENLPDWMDFYTLYVFNDFEGIGDVKTYDHAFDLRTIRQIIPRDDQKSFIVELNKYFIEISASENWKIFNWFKAIKDSYERSLEVKRSSNKAIKINVMVLLRHSLFNRPKQIQKEIEKMLGEVNPKERFSTFQKKIAAVFLKIDFMFDAFYSKQVVNYSLIKACMISIHIVIVKRMKKFWDLKKAKLGPYENLTFASLAVTYKEIVTSWGLIENELEHFVRPTIVNFIGSTFQKIKKVIAGIFMRAETEYDVIGDKIYSPGGQALINLCTETFDHYTTVPSEEACRYLLTIINRILKIYERFLINVVDEEEGEEMLAAHMNGIGKFIVQFRVFIKGVVGKTNHKYSHRQICEWVSDQKVLKSMTRIMMIIENKILIKLADHMKKTMAKKKDFLKFNLKSYLEKYFLEFQFVFNKIERSNLERISKKVLSDFSKFYIELALSDLDYYKKDYIQMSLQKIKNDINTTQLIFDSYLERDDQEKSIKRLQSLYGIWEAEEFGMFQMHFVNLLNLMKKSDKMTQIKLLDRIFKIRDVFTNDIKKFIKEDVEDVLSVINKTKNEKGSALFKIIRKQRIQMHVQKFIYNLRKAVEERKEKNRNIEQSSSKIAVNLKASQMSGKDINFSSISFQNEDTKNIPRGKATMISFDWKIKWGDLKNTDLDMKLINKMKKKKTNHENVIFVYWQVKEFGVELSPDSNYKVIQQTLLFNEISIIRPLDNNTLAIKSNNTIFIFKLQEKIKNKKKGFYRILRKHKKKSNSDSIKYRVKKFEMNINFGLNALTAAKIDLTFDFEKIKLEMQNEKKSKSKRRKSIELDI